MELSIGGLARGGIFLFTGSIISSILGYAFWFLVSFYSGVGIVGIASSVVTLSSLVTGIVSLDLPTGVQRFLGRELGHNNMKKLNRYFWSSLMATLTLCLLSALIIWIVAFLQIPVLGFSDAMLFFTGVIVLLSFQTVFASLFVSITRTESWAFSTVISAVVRVGLGVYLVYVGLGWVGALTGVIVASIFQLALMALFALRELRRLGGIEVEFSGKAVRESLHAGAVAWLPGVIALLGQQLGTLTVFGVQGGIGAGTYYIAYLIFTIVCMLPTSLNAMLFPALSGLNSKSRKDLARRALKICMALACPITVFLVLYPELPLSLMGAQYLEASSTLSILLLSIIPLLFIFIVGNLVYAAGYYGKSIAINSATSFPQVILYFVLVPIYKGIGAALSFSAGALIGSVVSMVISRLAHLRVPSGKIAIAVVVPFAVALPCYLLRLGWLISGAIILLSSIVSYGRMGVVERSDLAEIAQAFASEKTITKAGKRLNWLIRIIYGD
nr:polysaccharide biosynthesis C-terminal domain-containing protein [Candidatus Njordarchaeota archaeon]